MAVRFRRRDAAGCGREGRAPFFWLRIWVRRLNLPGAASRSVLDSILTSSGFERLSSLALANVVFHADARAMGPHSASRPRAWRGRQFGRWGGMAVGSEGLAPRVEFVEPM